MKRHQDAMSDSPLASNKRLQNRRRCPTVLCHFQRWFFSTAFHFSEKDTIDLWVASVNKSTESMKMKTKTRKKPFGVMSQ
jgi:hypothetical protein